MISAVKNEKRSAAGSLSFELYGFAEILSEGCSVNGRIPRIPGFLIRVAIFFSTGVRFFLISKVFLTDSIFMPQTEETDCIEAF